MSSNIWGGRNHLLIPFPFSFFLSHCLVDGPCRMHRFLISHTFKVIYHLLQCDRQHADIPSVISYSLRPVRWSQLSILDTGSELLLRQRSHHYRGNVSQANPAPALLAPTVTEGLTLISCSDYCTDVISFPTSIHALSLIAALSSALAPIPMFGVPWVPKPTSPSQ